MAQNSKITKIIVFSLTECVKIKRDANSDNTERRYENLSDASLERIGDLTYEFQTHAVISSIKSPSIFIHNIPLA